MKVLSLFDGMACAQIALRQLMLLNGFENLRVDTYYASEIDKHAIAQTRHNFPDTVQLGDVENWREWDIDWEHLDLVMGGSPCQGFSFAGKQLAFDDPRSRLFFVFAEILDYARSRNSRVKFLLENVNMKKDHLRIISKRVGVVPVKINSALVSAQNRNRWYWTDIRTRQEGLFGEVYSDIPQPEDRGILLRDILEFEVDEKYYLSDQALARAFRKNYSTPKINPEKAGTLNTKNNSGQVSFDSGSTFTLQRPRGYNQGGLHPDKSPTLSANAWEQNNLLVLGNIYDNGHNSMSGRVYSTEGKSTALRGEAGGGGGKTGLYLSGSRIRRLTPTECARLQTIPEWYEWICSETQQYRMLGNGWTVEVIKHILSCKQWN